MHFAPYCIVIYALFQIKLFGLSQFYWQETDGPTIFEQTQWKSEQDRLHDSKMHVWINLMSEIAVES